MIRWSLVAEFFSFIVLTILFLHYYGYEKNIVYTFRRKYYLACLTVSLCSIGLDVICVYTILYADLVPVWLNMTLNTLYFLCMAAICSLLSFYFFMLLLEHVYDKKCLKKAFVVVCCLTCIYVAAIIWNIKSGVLFYFDADRTYCRGPLNSLGYGVLGVELVFLILCYFRNRSSIGQPMIKVMHILPPVVFMTALLQVFYPKILLNGTLMAMSNLILFISFQSQTIDRDSLTGIRSRSNFLAELDLRIAGRQSTQVCMISLLNFSEVNLTYGYLTGDAILYEIAQYLDGLYPDGRAFRSGNVTFALTMPYRNPSLSDERIQTLLGRFQKSWTLGDISCRVAFKMADFCYTGEDCDSVRIIEYLEYALNLAHQECLELVRFDESVCRQYSQKKNYIETMKRSIAEHRFKVWYQPLFDCRKNGFYSAEALLRLTDYNGGIVSPDIFIPLAEETGLIDDLSWIVLEEICRMLSRPCPGVDYVTLNISMQQFMDPQLAARIRSFLDQYGISPGRLKIEITERVFFYDIKHAQEQLYSLLDAGIEIYIDDFGTGYANFSCVLQYPFTCIKLDRSLTAGITTDPAADLTVKTLMELFHTMDRTIIAEGVETREQALLLQSHGADMIQGFYYARPMPEEQFREFMSGNAPDSSSALS